MIFTPKKIPQKSKRSRPCAKTFLAVVHLLDLSWKMSRAASSSFLSSSFRLWMVTEESSEAVVRLGWFSLVVVTSSSSSKRHWGLLDLLLDFRFRFFFFLRLSEVLEIKFSKLFFPIIFECFFVPFSMTAKMIRRSGSWSGARSGPWRWSRMTTRPLLLLFIPFGFLQKGNNFT